jgi:hypothetical protein
MAGIAKQRDVAIRPALQRIAIDDRPFVHVGACGQTPARPGGRNRERLAQFPDVALRRPGLDTEIRLRLAGDEIDLAAVRLDVIDDDVAVLAPPFGAIVDLCATEQRGGIGGAVGDPPVKLTGEASNRMSLTRE